MRNTIVCSLVAASFGGSLCAATLTTEITGEGSLDFRRSLELLDLRQTLSSDGFSRRSSLSDGYALARDQEEQIGGVAEATANLDTGELTLFAFAQRNGAPGDLSSATTAARSTIEETLSITGTGTLTLFMDVTASVRDEVTLSAFSYGMLLSDDSRTINSQFVVRDRDFGGILLPGEIDRSLVMSTSFTDVFDQDITASWTMFARAQTEQDFSIGQTSAWINARNTGKIFFETTGSLVVTTSDSDFLSSSSFREAETDVPDDPAPVPLPASFLVLFAGLIMLTQVKPSSRRTANIGN